MTYKLTLEVSSAPTRHWIVSLLLAGLFFNLPGFTTDTRAAAGAGSIDHAGIIRSWDEQSFKRGEKLYNGLCITCHGNLQGPGSLPTSRPFWNEPFKNRSDPFSIYKTLTDGLDQMPPWPFLTPEQRYDLVHFIREEFVRDHNPGEYFKVTPEYLEGLPKGTGRGIKTPEMIEFAKGPKYLRMNYGPLLFNTLQVEKGNIAQKGIAIRLDEGPGGISRGNLWIVYDHDTLRVAAVWTGDKFVDWRGIGFDGSHGTHPSIVGTRAFVNPPEPGWADPQTGSFEDPRPRGLDKRPYGPLPRHWAHFKGVYQHGDQAILSYTVGDASILEMPGYERSGHAIAFSRTLNVGKSSRDLWLRLSPESVSVALVGESPARLVKTNGFNLLAVPAAETPLNVKVLLGNSEPAVDPSTLLAFAMISSAPEDLRPLTKGGPARWAAPLVSAGKLGTDDGPFAVDEITTPSDESNPWKTWMRFGGFDFFKDGRRAAICTWDGDVWIVSGIDEHLSALSWKRIASGLFQPLGLKIVNETIYVSCRDMIARLHDLNGNGEIDFIESFNNDHQVTEHFHEFAMGLETDPEGNFYYAKSARHALPPLVPHHGTLIKVSKDGLATEIIASGFRAANGVCVNPDGTFFVTDQEGHWIPKNRINRVRHGGFYGNMWSYHRPESNSNDAMEPPLVWITNEMDRSPAELLWVTSDQWGPLKGALLNLSYGTGKIYLVPHESVGDQLQGGVAPLPIPEFPTGVMRGRFHPGDGQLYACGLFSWAGNRTRDGGFYRVRYTGKPAWLPIGLETRSNGVVLKFTDSLDSAAAQDSGNYAVKIWGLNRSEKYGSPHVNERPLQVVKASLCESGTSVFLEVNGIEPTWCMEIKYSILGADGTRVSQRIHNTIHKLVN
jgi:hypothetical protein